MMLLMSCESFLSDVASMKVMMTLGMRKTVKSVGDSMLCEDYEGLNESSLINSS